MLRKLLNLKKLNKIGVVLVPIITPGSPPPPSLAGRAGIPSPNPNRAINNRGGPDSDLVANAPDFNASDGVRSSTLSTSEKQASLNIPAIRNALLYYKKNHA